MNASWLVLLSSLAVCAGCWEKIEYTGPRTIATGPRTPDQPPKTPEAAPAVTSPSGTEPVTASPVAAADDKDASAIAATPVETPEAPPAAPESSAVAETPVQPAPPKNDDDRYGLTKTEPSAPSPAPVEPPPATPPETKPVETPLVADAVASSPPPESAPAATERHIDATPTSATTDTSPSNVFDSHRAAWHLGSRLSLAALANDRRLAAQNVPIWFEDAKAAAKLLGTTVTDLPEPAAADDKSAISQQAYDYLVPKGKRIGVDIAKQHGAEDAALFEIALKSNLLMLMYTPGASAGNSIAAAIAQSAPKAKLPDELWKPLVEALNKQAPQADVRATVRKMHVDVDRYLAEGAERKVQ